MRRMRCQAFFEKKFIFLIYGITCFVFLVFSLVFSQMLGTQKRKARNGARVVDRFTPVIYM